MKYNISSSVVRVTKHKKIMEKPVIISANIPSKHSNSYLFERTGNAYIYTDGMSVFLSHIG